MVSLYQSGAVTRDTRVREDKDSAEWVALGTAFPFISGVQTTGYIAGRIQAALAGEKSCILEKIDLPFWHLVVVIVKIALAAIPAFLLLWALGGGLVYMMSRMFSSLR